MSKTLVMEANETQTEQSAHSDRVKRLIENWVARGYSYTDAVIAVRMLLGRSN